MPDIEIELPDGEIVLFPDGTSDAAIEAALSADTKATRGFGGGPVGGGGFGATSPPADLLTGELRGRGTLPELGSLADVPNAFTIAFGFFTTPDEAARADILTKNIPDVDFEKDEFGNTVVLLPDGRNAFLNAPGLSVQDFADLGSGIVKFLPSVKFARGGASLLTRVLRGGGAAGATSVAEDVAAQPFGSEQPIDLPRAGITAGLGAGAELVAPLLAAAPPVPTRARGVESFRPSTTPSGIALTRGEAAGDPTRLAREAQIRGEAGTGGDILRAQREAQTQQARGIIDEIQGDIAAAGGRPPIKEGVVGTGEIIEEVTGQAGKLLNSIDDAFDAARGANASISREGLDTLGNAKRVLTERGIEPDPALFPATTKALDKIDALAGKDVTSRTMAEIEQTRRVIGTLQGAAKTPSDKLGVGLLKKRFDQFLDDAFDNALFTGDEVALDLIKKARGLRTEFGKRFQENTRRTRSGKIVPDPGGKVVESILQKSPTDEAVSNMIFGRGRLFNDQNAVQTVKALRRATGDAPAVDSALQQMALRRIAQKAVRDNGFDPKAFVASFDDVMKQSPTLMRELFPGDILRRLRALRNDAQKLVVPRGASPVRVSATRKQLGDAWVSLMGALGLGGQLPGIPSGLRGGAIGRQVAGSGRRGLGAARSTQEALETVGGAALLPGRPNDLVISSIIAATRTSTEEQ